MGKIGILAYGSIIDSPDKEIEAATERKINEITTDFKIEFARTSTTRNGAPTLAIVIEGGSCVRGTLFILKKEISLQEAKNILLRREINKVSDTSVSYSKPKSWMEIKESTVKHEECQTIIYASMCSNISNPTAKNLAERAIASTKNHPMKNGKRADGIEYLVNVKLMGIITPLMNDYETEILSQLNVSSLAEALKKTEM